MDVDMDEIVCLLEPKGNFHNGMQCYSLVGCKRNGSLSDEMRNNEKIHFLFLYFIGSVSIVVEA